LGLSTYKWYIIDLISSNNIQLDSDSDILIDAGSGSAVRMRINGTSYITMTSSVPLLLNMPTGDLAITDATSSGGTSGAGYITITVGGTTRYIRINSTS
jgi:hypothetical protein